MVGWQYIQVKFVGGLIYYPPTRGLHYIFQWTDYGLYRMRTSPNNLWGSPIGLFHAWQLARAESGDDPKINKNTKVQLQTETGCVGNMYTLADARWAKMQKICHWLLHFYYWSRKFDTNNEMWQNYQKRVCYTKVVLSKVLTVIINRIFFSYIPKSSKNVLCVFINYLLYFL